MKVTLQRNTDPEIDLSARIDAESEVQDSQEIELDVMQRAVDDVQLSFSNLDGYFSTLFLSEPPSTVFKMRIYDDTMQPQRLMFKGRMTTPKTFSVRDQKLNLRIFATEKLFWENAGLTRVLYDYKNYISQFMKPNVSPFDTVQNFLSEQLIGRTEFSGLISNLVVDPAFASRPVRIYVTYSKINIITRGCFFSIDQTMTISELLAAFALYYNAEFWIDPETDSLMMTPRCAVLNDTQTDLDSILEDDEDISFDDCDDLKYDYLHAALSLPPPGDPAWVTTVYNFISGFASSFDGISNSASYLQNGIPKVITSGYDEGPYAWGYTYSVSIDGVNYIESPMSSICKDTGPQLLLRGVELLRNAVLIIPTGPTATVFRTIYRYGFISIRGEDGIGQWVSIKIGTIQDNTTTIFVDNQADSRDISQVYYSQQMASGDIYYSYDEVKGVWNAPVVNPTSSFPLVSPIGGGIRIFDILPGIRFQFLPTNSNTGGSYATATATTGDVYDFFGSEPSSQTFVEHFIDLLRIKRRIKATIKGTAYRIGDSFISRRGIFPNDYTPDKRAVARIVQNRFIAQRSYVELVTL